MPMWAVLVSDPHTRQSRFCKYITLKIFQIRKRRKKQKKWIFPYRFLGAPKRRHCRYVMRRGLLAKTMNSPRSNDVCEGRGKERRGRIARGENQGWDGRSVYWCVRSLYPPILQRAHTPIYAPRPISRFPVECAYFVQESAQNAHIGRDVNWRKQRG